MVTRYLEGHAGSARDDILVVLVVLVAVVVAVVARSHIMNRFLKMKIRNLTEFFLLACLCNPKHTKSLNRTIIPILSKAGCSVMSGV